VDVQGRRAHSPKCLQTQAAMQRAGRLAAALLSARHGAGRALLAPGACLRLQARVTMRQTPSLRLPSTCAALRLGWRLRRCFTRVRSSCTGTHAAATSHNTHTWWPTSKLLPAPAECAAVLAACGGSRPGWLEHALPGGRWVSSGARGLCPGAPRPVAAGARSLVWKLAVQCAL
jgi:hypothetical protein